MAQRQTLPVLPLRGTVIFPELTTPIAAGRPGTLRTIEAALRGDQLVFAVAQRKAGTAALSMGAGASRYRCTNWPMALPVRAWCSKSTRTRWHAGMNR